MQGLDPDPSEGMVYYSAESDCLNGHCLYRLIDTGEIVKGTHFTQTGGITDRWPDTVVRGIGTFVSNPADESYSSLFDLVNVPPPEDFWYLFELDPPDRVPVIRPDAEGIGRTSRILTHWSPRRCIGESLSTWLAWSSSRDAMGRRSRNPSPSRKPNPRKRHDAKIKNMQDVIDAKKPGFGQRRLIPKGLPSQAPSPEVTGARERNKRAPRV